MIVKPEIPFSDISGGIGGADRTIGREGSLAVSIKHLKGEIQLTSKTKATTGGSTARHARACDYQACDLGYKALGKVKQGYVKKFYCTVYYIPYVKQTNHSLYMKMCLLNAPELPYFKAYSYLTRYFILNDTMDPWLNKIIKLTGIQVLTASGKDLQVFESNNKGEIVGELQHDVQTKGECLTLIPYLKANSHITIDVYSYSKVEIPTTPLYETGSFQVSQDTYASYVSPWANFGYSTIVAPAWVTANNIRLAFIDIPKWTGKISLWVYVQVFGHSAFPITLRVYKTGAFLEGTLTWFNKPGQGLFVAEKTINNMGWNEIIMNDPGRYLLLTCPPYSASWLQWDSKDTPAQFGKRPYITLIPPSITAYAPKQQTQIGTRLL